MGLYLSSPCREVDAEEGTGNHLQYAVGEMQVSSSPFRSGLSDHPDFYTAKSYLHLSVLDLGQALLDLRRKHSNKYYRLIGIFECVRNPTISTSVIFDDAMTPHLMSEMIRSHRLRMSALLLV